MCRTDRINAAVKEERFVRRFWSKVSKSDGCWTWTCVCRKSEYGQIELPRRGGSAKAHRVSWAIEHGSVPRDLFVLHECDNKNCVRPSHLFLGTHQDNMDDMVAKGRATSPLGEDHGMSRFTVADVMRIRSRAGTVSNRTQAIEYGCWPSTIDGIVKRTSWSHV